MSRPRHRPNEVGLRVASVLHVSYIAVVDASLIADACVVLTEISQVSARHLTSVHGTLLVTVSRPSRVHWQNAQSSVPRRFYVETVEQSPYP